MSYTENTDGVVNLTKRRRHHEESVLRRQKQTPYWNTTFANVKIGTHFSRTPCGWLKIVCFFVIFYLCVILFWYICMSVFLSTLSATTPSVLLSQPGFSFAPGDLKRGSHNIEYESGVKQEIDEYIRKIFNFLDKYEHAISLPRFGPCVWSSAYGFTNNTPCIFLKINRIIGFKVIPYTDIRELPTCMPEPLKEYMVELTDAQMAIPRVWIACQTTDEFDSVKMDFYPHPYVLASALEIRSFKQWTNKGKNLFNIQDTERIVALHISNLPFNERVPFHCSLWAKNILQKSITGNTMINFNIKIKT